MSRLDFCKYELVDDCYDWKNDNCDKCNIFKAYCEGARRAKNSIVRCKDCRHANECHKSVQYTRNERNTVTIGYSPIEWCSMGERREP